MINKRYYFNNENAVKILKMDSETYGASNDNLSAHRQHSRNSQTRKNAGNVSKTISSSQHLQSEKAK